MDIERNVNRYPREIVNISRYDHAVGRQGTTVSEPVSGC